MLDTQGAPSGHLSDLSDVREVRVAKRRSTPTASLKAAYSRLVRYAHAQLITNLEKYGNTISREHHRALLVLLWDMTKAARGDLKGRYGYPIPCGGGKTQAAVCWSWAAWYLGTGLSVSIASSRVDNLVEIQEELRKLGVPKEAIGLLHSKSDHPEPPTQDNDQRPIMLVTHSRLQGGDKNLPQYAYYKGRKRSLFIYDESLVSTDNWSISLRSLKRAVGAFKGESEGALEDVSDARRTAYGYLEACKDLIHAEMVRQQKGREPRLVVFPPLPFRYLPDELAVSLEEEDQDRFAAVFRHTNGSARALRVQALEGCVWFNITLPDALDTIIVLDASLVVRLLPKLSGQIGRNPAFPDNVVSYENVTLHHMPMRAGRGSFADLFWNVKNARRRNGFIRELAYVINTKIPDDEAVNVWTFKTRNGKDYARQLSVDLKRHGVDVNAQVYTSQGVKPRINILPWGQETATNKYSCARHTMFAGVIHRDLLDLAAETVGANRNLLSERNLSRVQEIQASEAAHMIYQAASRSAIRHHRNGVAEHGTIWLPIKTAGVLSLLQEHAWPGIKRVPWLSLSDDWRERESASATTARRIANVLTAFPDEVEEISARQLSVSLPGGKPTNKVWRDAQSLLAENPPEGWTRKARSWVRV